MFLKNGGFKPRANSDSSQSSGQSDMSDSPSTTGKGVSSSNNSQPGATKGGASAAPTPANNVGGSSGRRRSSAEAAFSGLSNLKRNSGSDPELDAKKASFMEQKPGATNPLASMWNNFTKGPTGAG